MRELLDNLLRLSDEDDFDYIGVVISPGLLVAVTGYFCP